MRTFQLPLRRPRHPLLRALSLVVALLVVGAMLVFGLMVAGVMLVGGALWLAIRQWRRGASPTRVRGGSTEVLEGEYVVLHDHRQVLH